MTFLHASVARRRVNRAGLQFLMIDMGVANTLLHTAALTADPELARRTRSAAREAYWTMVDLMDRLDLTASEREGLVESLADLDARLGMHCV